MLFRLNNGCNHEWRKIELPPRQLPHRGFFGQRRRLFTRCHGKPTTRYWEYQTFQCHGCGKTKEVPMNKYLAHCETCHEFRLSTGFILAVASDIP